MALNLLKSLHKKEGNMKLLLCLLLLTLVGCGDDNLNPSTTKTNFINTIFDSEVDDSPFSMSYSLRTVLFSKEIISLFGHTDVYTHLPHSWGHYEGKTYCKINGKFKEVSLNDIFTTTEQKEFLRDYCESDLKHRSYWYFGGDEPILTQLDADAIHTFVVDEKSLIIVFSPYSVGNYVDGPHIIQIPYEELKDHWNPKNPIATLLPLADFTSSWDLENFYYQLSNDSKTGN
jgi:Protein of unknown function (DUF3298)